MTKIHSKILINTLKKQKKSVTWENHIVLGMITPCVNLRKTRVQTLITNQPKRNGEIGEQVLDNISDRSLDMISLKE